jgi:serine/threonine-protein kinase
LPEGFEAIGPPLGVGATAVVWHARRVLDGRELALKVWRRPFADDGERARFRREIRRQAALNEVSGHIVTYTWAEEDPGHGTPWIGTLRHGSSLQQLLERGGPPLPQRLVLCADLLAGLAAMHGQGLVHRDVKPANVLADGSRAKLCDLGLVLDRAGWTQDGAAGTPRYLAPELLRGDQPSPRSDVYSAARTIAETLGPGLPAPLERLLTSAASADPAGRPTDAGAFAVQFRQACAELGELLPPPLPGRSESSSTRPHSGVHGAPVARARRSRPVLVAAGVAVAAAATAVLVPGPADRSGPAAFATPSAAPAETAPATTSSARARPPATRPQASSPARTSPAATATDRPDARAAAPDIGPGGDPVVLPATRSGQCGEVLAGARTGEERSYRVDGTLVAVLQTFSSNAEQRSCARLVKPAGSPDAGVRTHLALTLCGDGNSCDSDWHGYTDYAGPVIVRSRSGCVSWRISVRDRTGTRWLVRDSVGSSGCP